MQVLTLAHDALYLCIDWPFCSSSDQTKLQAGSDTEWGGSPLGAVLGPLVLSAVVPNVEINPTVGETAPGFEITAVILRSLKMPSGLDLVHE